MKRERGRGGGGGGERQTDRQRAAGKTGLKACD